MKKLFLTACLAASGLFAMAQEKANPNAADIQFEAETIDYGTIDQGADGNRTFVFTNTGKEPLIITKTQGSCGCTVPSHSKEPIAPGEKGEIKVKYDTKRVGPFTKTVTVTSNAASGTKQLRIKGTVTKKVVPATSPEKETKTSLMEAK